jgi:hypothetical protein
MPGCPAFVKRSGPLRELTVASHADDPRLVGRAAGTGSRHPTNQESSGRRGTVIVEVVLCVRAHQSRHCSGDPLRGPPSEHEPTATSRSAVDPPPKMSAVTDDDATIAHAHVSYPLWGVARRWSAQWLRQETVGHTCSMSQPQTLMIRTMTAESSRLPFVGWCARGAGPVMRPPCRWCATLARKYWGVSTRCGPGTYEGVAPGPHSPPRKY